MKIIEDILDYILSLDTNTLRRYILIFITGTALFLGGMTLLVNQKAQKLVSQIENMQKLATKSASIATDYRKIQIKKEHTVALLEKEGSFEIKSFFENFTKENNIKAEPNWTTLSSQVEGNTQLEEIILPLTFKKLTMQKLIKTIEALNKNEMVYVKTLAINKNKDKTVSVDLTVATFNYKKP